MIAYIVEKLDQGVGFGEDVIIYRQPTVETGVQEGLSLIVTRSSCCKSLHWTAKMTLAIIE
jgi:hypothetical protein